MLLNLIIPKVKPDDGKANIVRVLVHDHEIATAGRRTKIGGIVTETGIGIAIGRGIANAIVIVDAVHDHETGGTGRGIATIRTERGETETGTGIEEERDR